MNDRDFSASKPNSAFGRSYGVIRCRVQKTRPIKEESGAFRQWLGINSSKTLKEWTKLFKKTFTFVEYDTGSEHRDSFYYGS